MSSVRTTPNREMCVRGEAAWAREAWLLYAGAESTKFSFFSSAGFGLVFDDSYTLCKLFGPPIWESVGAFLAQGPWGPWGGALGPWGA